MNRNRTIDFFDSQFQRQVSESEFALNPFEQLAQPFLRGRMLDLGCGLGNLSIEGARRGCSALALDASVSAIERIRAIAAAEALPIQAEVADLAEYHITEGFDTVVAIGLLMFFPKLRALELLEEIKAQVLPGGCAIVNVLTEGTTYLGMFEPGYYYLFGQSELQERFAEWELPVSRSDNFPAPDGTVKVFTTVVARKP
jgi:tellurite methyltransferase